MFAEPWHGAFLLGSFGNTVKSRVDTKMSNSIDLGNEQMEAKVEVNVTPTEHGIQWYKASAQFRNKQDR